MLIPVFDSINSYKPDIIVNTGDFVTLLWAEMEPFTALLGTLEAEYGVYAVPGNHDTGLYSGDYNEDNFDEHLDMIEDMLQLSAHIYLQDTSICISLDTLSISLTGVATYGSVPNLSYGDTDSALRGTRDSDFRILLSHDPNHWVQDIQERDDIKLTLSGHTHGMQLGIPLNKRRFSPARLLYPAWNGLYGGDNNFLYVNRGLGTIGIPARIGMPPEVTIIILKAKAPPSLARVSRLVPCFGGQSKAEVELISSCGSASAPASFYRRW